MEKEQARREKNVARMKGLLFAIAFSATVLFVIGGVYVQEGFDVSVGQIAEQRIKAPRRIENTVATERNRVAAEEAAEKMEPVIERDTSVNDKALDNINSFFSRVDILRREAAHNNAAEVPAEGAEVSSPPTPAMPIHLNDSLTDLILRMRDDDYARFAGQVAEVTRRIFENGIQDVDAKGLLMVKEEVDKLDMRSDEKNLCYEIIAAYIEPNIVVNEEATQAARGERAEKYDIVYYLKDETIVDEGRRITEEAYAAMEALGLVEHDGGWNTLLIAGALVLVSGMFTMFLLYLKLFAAKTISTRKEALLFFTLYIGVISVCYLTVPLPYPFSANLIFAMLVAMLFDSRLAIFTNVFVTCVCMLITKGDMGFMLYYLFTGTFAGCLSRFTNERNKVIIAGAVACLVSFLSYLGVTFFFERSYSQDVFNGAMYAVAMGLFSLIVSIGSTPFWEAVFGIVTPYRLIDLANPNNPVLRRLTLEAPGTYHHSLVVANLSETAAYEIGANTMLARAGGYFHDIGKLKYPQYFAENQIGGANPHDGMDPHSSAQVLKSHVSFGLELAEKHHIPQIIQDIICQHHGTTLIKYFYMKARDMMNLAARENGEEDCPEPDEDDFRYNYMVPQSKEAAVVMLADTVEAAVRSMGPSSKSMSEIENLVRKLVKDKLEDGQLLDSELTIKDIETVTQAFLLVFKGMYHDRIPYPEVVKKKKEGGDET